MRRICSKHCCRASTRAPAHGYSGPLRLIVARALGTVDLPPYGSLEEFAEALSRFAAADSEHCVRELIANRLPRSPLGGTREDLPMVVSSSQCPDDKVITISDIRRARRATGLTLADISGRIGVPVPLLCELEWGYLDNWPASPAVRRHIVSYARAAGLDDQLVVRTVWPLFEQSLHARGYVPGPQTLMSPPVVVDAVPVEDDQDETDVEGLVECDEHTTVMIHPALAAHHSRRRSTIVAAFVIPALLAIAIAPAAWEPLSQKDRTLAARPPQPDHDASSRRGADLPVHAIDRDEREPSSSRRVRWTVAPRCLCQCRQRSIRSCGVEPPDRAHARRRPQIRPAHHEGRAIPMPVISTRDRPQAAH